MPQVESRPVLASLLALWAGSVACGEAAEGGAERLQRPSAKDWDEALGVARVAGRVRFAGEPPPRRVIDMSSEVACRAASEHAHLEESVLVGEDGGLANAFVYVESGLAAWRFELPDEVVVLDQRGCVYRPRVLGVRVGQRLTVRNSDPVLHNVHVLAETNPPANLAQKKGGADLQLLFDRPEVTIPIQCDVHGWMRAYVGVVEHPFFAVSEHDGTFDLGRLPPGEYTVAAVHERLGRREARLLVRGELADPLEIVF